MKIEIKNRWYGTVIYSGEHETFKDAVVAAIAKGISLSGADMRGADMSGADMSGADMRDADMRDADLSGAVMRGADLSGAVIRGANMSGANMRDADLSYADMRDANMSGADMRGADMNGADMSDAVMPGFKDKIPASLNEAVNATKDWLAGGHWTQGAWIKTPTGAYNGDCLACLHGAVSYVGGPFGPELSDRLRKNGYTEQWNDRPDRTLEDVLGALDAVRV